MTSISLVAGVDLFWPPWSSHWSMEPGPWDDVHPFSPKAKGPGPPEVTAAANSMLSIRGSPAPPSGPVQFSTSACMPSPAARKTKTKTWSSKYRTQMFGFICIWIWLYRFYINQVSHGENDDLMSMEQDRAAWDQGGGDGQVVHCTLDLMSLNCPCRACKSLTWSTCSWDLMTGLHIK